MVSCFKHRERAGVYNVIGRNKDAINDMIRAIGILIIEIKEISVSLVLEKSDLRSARNESYLSL